MKFELSQDQNYNYKYSCVNSSWVEKLIKIIYNSYIAFVKFKLSIF